MNTSYTNYLRQLESESIYIIREVVAEFKNPVMLYSIGKDSSVMVRLAQKAFFPARFPFPLLHVDTGFKFGEMLAFRDAFIAQINALLVVERNEEWIEKRINPQSAGMDRCCSYLKTQALLMAIRKHRFDAAFGGARREEEKSRAKERIFSMRGSLGQWDPKNQRPEIWGLYNTRINADETMRVFPLSNWTEHDIWQYIRAENIPVVPLYFARKRKVVPRDGVLVPLEYSGQSNPRKDDAHQGQVVAQEISCRFRSLGCMPCTGVIPSTATTIDAVIAEVAAAKNSERENRAIDRTSDSSMELKKREGYF
jgi:sulfate adenylyltransferase subunit 2